MSNDSPSMMTEHFSWAEANITQHREINNDIPTELKEDILRTAMSLEKVRALLGVPIVVNSFYRSPELNRAVGGSSSSDHMVGKAVDFVAPQFGTCLQIAMTIAENKDLIRFKQLILEHTWVHISFPIPGVPAKLEVLSLLDGGRYAQGLTNKYGTPLA